MIAYSRLARVIVRAMPMMISGFHFGAGVHPVEAAPQREPNSEANPLQSYFETHREGPGIYKGRHYFDVYVRHLEGFVGREPVVVEIGVYSGGSLGMWKSYFGEHATIHGVDIEEACRVYETEDIHIHIGDQADRGFWSRFKQKVPVIDVLIDDGGHHPNEMRVTFEELFPILRPGGVYICEDIINGNEFLAYLGGLAEHLTTYETAPPSEPGVASAASSFQQAVRSIHLYPFVAVIERTVATVTEFQFPKHGSERQPPGFGAREHWR